MEKVIVYQSATQARTDEFLAENPQYILGYFVLAIVFIVAMGVTNSFLEKRWACQKMGKSTRTGILWAIPTVITAGAFLLLQYL